MLTKEIKSSAALQAIFKAELNKLGLAETEKLSIQPVSNNSRFTWAVFQAGVGKDGTGSVEAAHGALSKALQERYDLADEP